MKTKAETRGLPINVTAWRLAFKAGQEVERLLLERADALAVEAGQSSVTMEHVSASVDQDILVRLLNYLHEYDGSQIRRAG